MNDQLLFLQLARGLGIDSKKIAKDARYGAERLIVSFPSLKDILGNGYFAVGTIKDPNSLFIQMMTEPKKAFSQEVMRSYRQAEVVVPYHESGAYFAFVIQSPGEAYVIYRALAIEMTTALFVSLGKGDKPYVIEPFHPWLATLSGKSKSSRDEQPCIN